MADGQIIRFKIREGFPPDERLARWMTVCAMALNDILLVNRWLVPRLQEKIESQPHENFYLGRLAAAHLFEVATFLRKSDRQLPEVRDFVAKLDDNVRAAYDSLMQVGDGGSGKLYEQLKHARNTTFHYRALISGEGEEFESLKNAMEGHARDEDEKDIRRGEIQDIPPSITGFRSVFADDIATEMVLPEDTDAELPGFLQGVAGEVANFLMFVRAAFNAYTLTREDKTWDVEDVPGAR